MLSLPNNCRCSEIKVFPKDWKSRSASIDVNWYIHYRFYLPEQPGELVIIKGMNHLKTYMDRRDVTRMLIQDELTKLHDGYNPLTKGKTAPIVEELPPPPVSTNDLEVLPATPLSIALEKGYNLLRESNAKDEVRKALVHIQAALIHLGYDTLPVGEVEQKHLEVLLIKIGENKKAGYEERRKKEEVKKKYFRPSRIRPGEKRIPTEWGPAGFNHYRSYLIMLFKQIKKVGGTKYRPASDIEKRVEHKVQRRELNEDDINRIFRHLKENYYTFWRFCVIFYRSGARITELVNMKKEDVDLANNKFWVTLRKGRGVIKRAPKTIVREVAFLWEEILFEAMPGQHLFSLDLRPGNVLIDTKQISIRWFWHVKQKLGITEDLYFLKHTNTTRVIDIAMKKIHEATAVAAEMNSHTSNDMNRKVYDLRSSDRLHQELLNMNISNG